MDVLELEIVEVVELEGTEEVGGGLEICTDLVEMVEVGENLDEAVKNKEEGEPVFEEAEAKVVELDSGGEIDITREGGFGESAVL
jgi:hypothetical protein